MTRKAHATGGDLRPVRVTMGHRLHDAPLMMALLLFPLLITATGCVEFDLGDSADGPATRPPKSCEQHQDCDHDRICVEGVCVANRDSGLLVTIHVTPPHAQGLKFQQFFNLPVGRDEQMEDLQLQRTVVLKGRVTNNPLTDNIRARVVATAQRDVSDAQPWRTETRAEDGAREFSLDLVPGVYNLTFFPDNPLLPPHRVQGIPIADDEDMLFMLPDPSEYLLVQGRVLASEQSPHSVPEVKVQAFSDNQEHLSTVSTTAQDGSFEIILPPGERVYTFRLSPTENNPFYPTVDFPSILVEDRNLHLGTLYLGVDESPVDVGGAILNSEGHPVANAQVEFHRGTGNGSFNRNAATDEEGRYEARLLPGQYQARIIPPLESPLAISTQGFEVDAHTDGLPTWTLELKSPFLGRVLNPATMEAVSGVTVEALLTDNVGGTGLYRNSLAVTGTDGTFAMRVDPGIYSVTLIPPPGRGLPRWTEVRVTLPTDESVMDFTLKEPALIYGAVVGPQGAPLPGSTVEIFLTTPPPDAPPVSSSGTRTKRSALPLLIGTGLTDEQGQYRIILPIP